MNVFSLNVLLDNVLGRRTTREEYDYYFMNSPSDQKYMQYKNEFAREDIITATVLNNINTGLYNQYSFYPQQSYPQQQYPYLQQPYPLSGYNPC